MTMIERVATAIDEELMTLGIGLKNIKVGIPIARKVFEAMAEPTPEMVEAGHDCIINGGNSKEIFKYMIDIASKDVK